MLVVPPFMLQLEWAHVRVPSTRGGPGGVLGLSTTKAGAVERVDDLVARVEDAQRFIDIDQLAISPQCGFASGIGGNILSEDDQWRKLDVMQEAARKIWG